MHFLVYSFTKQVTANGNSPETSWQIINIAISVSQQTTLAAIFFFGQFFVYADSATTSSSAK